MFLFPQQVLSDEGKRRDYDSFGMSGARGSAGPSGGFQGGLLCNIGKSLHLTLS